MPDKEPIVFIHGWGAMPGVYQPALRALRQERRVYAPILPGHGGRASIRVAGEGVFPALADDVVSRLPSNVKCGVWVGHSLGGGVALQAALRYPDRVSRLVLVCPVGGDGDVSIPGFVRLLRGSARETRENENVTTRESAVTLGRLLRHPLFASRVGLAAKYAHFERLLAVLVARGLPIHVYTADSDHITQPIPIVDGVRHEMGPGRHSWPVEEPERFVRWLQTSLSEEQSLNLSTGDVRTVSEAFA